MFYTTVDALIVGKTIGAVAVGVIGATGSISSLIISSGQVFTTGMSLLFPVILVLKTRKMFKGNLLSGFVFQLHFHCANQFGFDFYQSFIAIDANTIVYF